MKTLDSFGAHQRRDLDYVLLVTVEARAVLCNARISARRMPWIRLLSSHRIFHSINTASLFVKRRSAANKTEIGQLCITLDFGARGRRIGPMITV